MTTRNLTVFLTTFVLVLFVYCPSLFSLELKGEVVEVAEEILTINLGSLNGVSINDEGYVLAELIEGEAPIKTAKFMVEEVSVRSSKARIISLTNPVTATQRVLVKISKTVTQIVTTPKGAQIRLDGKDISGRTPFVLLGVKPGEHEIEASIGVEYYAKQTVTINDEAENKVDITLKVVIASLQIDSQPRGANVKINGQPYGKTPLTLEVQPGDYRILFSLSDYGDEVRNIKLGPGDQVQVAATLAKVEMEETPPPIPQDIALDADAQPTEIAGMRLIPAGEFIMGSASGATNEKPERRVKVSAFYIDKFPVTNRQYKEFCSATGRAEPPDPGFGGDYTYNYFTNKPDYPVVNVTWQDASAYAKWAGKQLPTEAQWEKAARGSGAALTWPWGDDFSVEMANTSISGDHFKFTSPVGFFKSNVSPYGVIDMAGNVWEWCLDWFDEKYYQRNEVDNPQGPQNGATKVLRGGSWNQSKSWSRCTARFDADPSSYFDDVGFRCVVTRHESDL